jgi:hypothetical protein
MNTEERIKQILNELPPISEIDEQIIKLELENLVVEAQLEELRKEK